MLFTENQVIERIRVAASTLDGGQREFAKMYGVREQYLCDLLAHRRKLSSKLLAAFGLRKIVRFEPMGKDKDAA